MFEEACSTGGHHNTTTRVSSGQSLAKAFGFSRFVHYYRYNAITMGVSAVRGGTEYVDAEMSKKLGAGLV